MVSEQFDLGSNPLLMAEIAEMKNVHAQLRSEMEEIKILMKEFLKSRGENLDPGGKFASLSPPILLQDVGDSALFPAQVVKAERDQSLRKRARHWRRRLLRRRHLRQRIKFRSFVVEAVIVGGRRFAVSHIKHRGKFLVRRLLCKIKMRSSTQSLIYLMFPRCYCYDRQLMSSSCRKSVSILNVSQVFDQMLMRKVMPNSNFILWPLNSGYVWGMNWDPGGYLDSFDGENDQCMDNGFSALRELFWPDLDQLLRVENDSDVASMVFDHLPVYQRTKIVHLILARTRVKNVNPWNDEAVSEAMYWAISMREQEKEMCHEKHCKHVSYHDITLNPFWKPIILKMQQFVSKDNPFIIECFDFNSNVKYSLIGKLQKSIPDLEGLYLEKVGTNFTEPTRLNIEKISKAQLDVDKFKEKGQYSFLDYISSGFDLNLMVAVKFTASNGNPHSPYSLHFMDHSGRLNTYQEAIQQVGEVVQFYDSNRHVNAWGFGGKLEDGTLSHCFCLNGHVLECEGEGVEGIMSSYRSALYNVAVAGPTLFVHVIKKVAQLAIHAAAVNQRKYYVLLIITDEVVTDLQETKDAIVATSELPFSIFIVGVGRADLQKMEILETNKGQRLQSLANRIATPVIVQFVPMNEVNSCRMCFSIFKPIASGLANLFLIKLKAALNQIVNQEKNSNVSLFRVLVIRISPLLIEQEKALGRATTAGFNPKHIRHLFFFAACFGASRVLEACLRYMELWKKKHEAGRWLMEIEGNRLEKFPFELSSWDIHVILISSEKNSLYSKGYEAKKVTGPEISSQIRNFTLCINLQEVHARVLSKFFEFPSVASEALSLSLGFIHEGACDFVTSFFHAMQDCFEGCLLQIHEHIYLFWAELLISLHGLSLSVVSSSSTELASSSVETQPDAQNGLDVFHTAAKLGHFGVLKELLKSFPQLAMTIETTNSTELQTAAAQGHYEVVNLLLETESSLATISKSNGKTVLHSAAWMGHLEIIKSLLDREPKLNAKKDQKGQTVVHRVLMGINIAVVLELIKSDPSIIQYEDNMGNTILHIATRKVRTQMMRALVSPLDIAKKSTNEELVSLLKAANVINFQEQGTTPAADNKKLKQTVSDIKYEVHTQFHQSRKIGMWVQKIANKIYSGHGIQGEITNDVCNQQHNGMACLFMSVVFIVLTYVVVGSNGLWLAISTTAIGCLIMLAMIGSMCYFIIMHRIDMSNMRNIRTSATQCRNSCSWSHSKFQCLCVGDRKNCFWGH